MFFGKGDLSKCGYTCKHISKDQKSSYVFHNQNLLQLRNAVRNTLFVATFILCKNKNSQPIARINREKLTKYSISPYG
ncbi:MULTISPECIES: hypothetical protein [Niastella]|uniref:hypothetical protein n=1 Tax=Niastella TaxID=354354 RepID=UPI0036128397